MLIHKLNALRQYEGNNPVEFSLTVNSLGNFLIRFNQSAFSCNISAIPNAYEDNKRNNTRQLMWTYYTLFVPCNLMSLRSLDK